MIPTRPRLSGDLAEAGHGRALVAQRGGSSADMTSAPAATRADGHRNPSARARETGQCASAPPGLGISPRWPENCYLLRAEPSPVMHTSTAQKRKGEGAWSQDGGCRRGSACGGPRPATVRARLCCSSPHPPPASAPSCWPQKMSEERAMTQTSRRHQRTARSGSHWLKPWQRGTSRSVMNSA